MNNILRYFHKFEQMRKRTMKISNSYEAYKIQMEQIKEDMYSDLL